MTIQSSHTPHIASVATATPPLAVSQDVLEQLAHKHFKGRLSSRSLALIHALFSHPSIRQRNFAIDNVENLVDEDLDARVARFTHWSQELSAQAINRALGQRGLGAGDVSGLVVNTCTGYICPGISTYLIEKLGLSRSVRVYDLVGSGCGGAIPNLEIAGSLARQNDGGVVVSVAVEICTATFQMEDDLSLLLSNALFGDGAAAAVVWTRPEGYELVASASRYVPEKRDSIRFVHKKGQLYNQLSLKLPDYVRKAAAGVVEDLLAPRSLTPREINHWALHTGGEKIINAVRDEIGLSEELNFHGVYSYPDRNGDETWTGTWLLWPDEPAWKLRLEFGRRGSFAPNELWHIQGIPVPGRDSFIPTNFQTNLQGVSLVVRGISDARGFLADGTMSVNATSNVLDLTWTPSAPGLQVLLMEVKDDHGQKVQVNGSAGGDHGAIGYGLNLASNILSVDALFAVRRSRVVEFLAKPELGATNLGRASRP